MRYLPHTDEDIASMLKAVGVNSLDELFSMVPADCRFTGKLDLPEPLTEWELNDFMDSLAGSMGASPGYKAFIGAGLCIVPAGSLRVRNFVHPLST